MKKYQKITVQSELKRLKRKTSDPLDRAALDWALKCIQAGLAQTDIAQLESLFRLEDPRGAGCD